MAFRDHSLTPANNIDGVEEKPCGIQLHRRVTGNHSFPRNFATSSTWPNAPSTNNWSNYSVITPPPPAPRRARFELDLLEQRDDINPNILEQGRGASAPRPRPAAFNCCGPSARWKTD
jgi:hypothetical protein